MAEKEDTDANDIRSIVLLLASDDLSHSSNKELKSKISQAESMIKDEEVRWELSADVAMNAAITCSTDDACERIMSLLLSALLLEARSAHDDTSGSIKNLSEALCHLLVQRDTASSSSSSKPSASGGRKSPKSPPSFSLTQKAEEMLRSALGGLNDNHGSNPKHVQAYLLSEGFLAVARAPVSSTNRGRYGPALILANAARAAAPLPIDGDETKWNSSKETEAEAFRRDLMDLLGRRIFALGGSAEPANASEVSLCAPLIKKLTKDEFERAIVRPMKFKLMTAPGLTMETLAAFIKALSQAGNGGYIDSHLGSGTDLVQVTLKQIHSPEPKYREDGAKVMKAIVVASPVIGCRAAVEALTEAVKKGLKSLNRTHSDNALPSLYKAFKYVAKGLISLRQSNMSAWGFSDEEEWRILADRYAIPVLEKAAEAEDEAEDGSNEDLVVKALRVWMEVSGREAPLPSSGGPPAIEVGGAAAAVTLSATAFGSKKSSSRAEQQDKLAMKRARASAPASRPGVQSVRGSEVSRLDERIAAKQRRHQQSQQQEAAPALGKTAAYAAAGAALVSHDEQGQQSPSDRDAVDPDILAKRQGRRGSNSSRRGSNASSTGVQSLSDRDTDPDILAKRLGRRGSNASRRGSNASSTGASSPGAVAVTEDSETGRRSRRGSVKGAAAGPTTAPVASNNLRQRDLSTLEQDVLAKSQARGGGDASRRGSNASSTGASSPGVVAVTEDSEGGRRSRRGSAKAEATGPTTASVASNNLRQRDLSTLEQDVLAKSQTRGVEDPSVPGAQIVKRDSDVSRLDERINAKTQGGRRRSSVGSSSSTPPSPEDDDEPVRPGAHRGLEADEFNVNRKILVGSGAGVTVTAVVGDITKQEELGVAVPPTPITATVDIESAIPKVNEVSPPVLIEVPPSAGIEEEPVNTPHTGGQTVATSRGITNEPNVEYGEMSEDGVSRGIGTEPAVDYGRAGPGDDTGPGGLAIAVAVEDEDEDVAFLTRAVEYDPDSKPPLYKNRRFRLYGLAAILLVVVVVVGTTVGVTKNVSEKKNDQDNQRNQAPTMQPTSVQYVELREKLSPVFGLDAIVSTAGGSDTKTPQALAFEWIANEDPLNLNKDDENLVQRAVLASFYFSTTRKGTNWTYCGKSQEDECTWYRWDDEEKKEPIVDMSWLSGTHECFWYGVFCDEKNITRVLWVEENNLNGRLPNEISHLKFLQNLKLLWNQLTGTIPSALGEMKHLIDIELHYNLMTGSIPAEIYDADALQRLNLGSNLLDGPLSDRLGELTSMKGYFTFENALTGTIPSEIGLMEYCVFMRHQRNFFNGTIPTELGYLRKLKELFLYRNFMTGSTIPTELGNLKDMEHLRIEYMGLKGTIPEQIFDLTRLIWLYLYDNELTGTLSTKVGQLADVEMLIVKQNLLNGTIPTELAQLTKATDIWVYWNDFTGPVPAQTCSLFDSQLQDLKADCDPYEGVGEPQNPCTCCTECCDSAPGGLCKAV